MCGVHSINPFSDNNKRKEEPDIEGRIAAAKFVGAGSFPKAQTLSRNEALKQIEAHLLVAKKALEGALELEQAARNLLAALTPEGKVEKLAAKKLTDALGGDQLTDALGG